MLQIWGFMCLFYFYFLYTLNLCPGMRLLNQIIVLLLVFCETSILLSILAAPIYIPMNSAKVPFSPHPFKHLLFMDNLMIVIVTGVKWYLIIFFIYISPIKWTILNIFSCVCWASVYLLKKKSLFGPSAHCFWL